MMMLIANARNLKHPDTWPVNYIYCGRAMPRKGLKGSPLGNPYQIGEDGDRETVIRHYKKLFEMAVSRRDRIVIAAFRVLTPDSVLVCWCRDETGTEPVGEACHCEVIRDIWYAHFAANCAENS